MSATVSRASLSATVVVLSPGPDQPGIYPVMATLDPGVVLSGAI